MTSTTKYTITGKLFARRPVCPHCGSRYTDEQGIITGLLGDDLVIVQYLDVLSGSVTWGHYIVPRSDLADYVLYDSADEMAEHYEYGGVSSRDERHVEQCSSPRWEAEAAS